MLSAGCCMPDRALYLQAIKYMCKIRHCFRSNGTCRTGNLWQAKTNTDTDPVPAATKTSLVIDPDAANFQTQLSTLSTVFDTYFKRVSTDTPMDTYNGSAMNILFKQNYYVFGLPNGVITNNGWLLQTKGWKDAYGADGTYDYQP